MKRLKRQKEIKLRKWCMEQAVKFTHASLGTPGVRKEAQGIYDWITSKPLQ